MLHACAAKGVISSFAMLYACIDSLPLLVFSHSGERTTQGGSRETGAHSMPSLRTHALQRSSGCYFGHQWKRECVHGGAGALGNT